MAYGTFKTLEEVGTKFDIESFQDKFINEIPFEIPEIIYNLYKKNLENKRNYVSENSICEMIIAPILNIVANKHDLPIWSHVKLDVSPEDGLIGVPDFLIAPASKFGMTYTTPLVCVAEVKKENFEEGWIQVLSEMIASQRLNNNPQKTIYGIATSGEFWKFAKLIDKQFIMDPIPYSAPMDLQRLLNALNWLLGEVKKQLDNG